MSDDDLEAWSVVMPILGAAFAASIVWLAVRIINRRERWAKRVLAAVIGIPVLYAASFGPALWLMDHKLITGHAYLLADQFYLPLHLALAACPDPITEAFAWYNGLWAG